MKFSAREDIAAPIEAVFGEVSDFDAFERAALRRGAEVQRIGGAGGAMTKLRWKVGFDFRGKKRDLDARLVRFDAPDTFVVEAKGRGTTGVLTVDLVPLSPRQTRLAVGLDIRPTTLSARLFLQSLRLAKNNLSRKFKSRVGKFAREIEGRVTDVNRRL